MDNETLVEQTMVEKVARGICGAQPHMRTLMQINVTDWLTEIDNGWKDHIPEAQAALIALRKPDLTMLLAGKEEGGKAYEYS